MRKTLRRSCDTCARSKLRCDLLIPRCTRCTKKGLECVYANEPLPSISDSNAVIKEEFAITLMPTIGQSPFMSEPGIQSLDPFDSLPRTRLPRAQVQQLIQHFLSSIAFQYYPLDLDAASNPFVVSWWPLALADPALFHVSLQTASLDIDLRSQRGFATSDILMADSVALVRSKIEDPICAAQDETMDSVVTLAAIEFGKGNVDVSNMHIDGVKSMVRLRGGIENVKQQNPLTARMVAWVSLVLSQSPQFATQDDFGFGVGLNTPAQWLEPGSSSDDSLYPYGIIKDLDPDIQSIISRLASIFRHAALVPLSTTELHDLTCFVLHRLLSWSPRSMPHKAPESVTSECVRSALVLYMLILHGPTYFSHALLQQKSVSALRSQFEILLRSGQQHGALTVWLLSVGLVASDGMLGSEWFSGCAVPLASSLGLQRWCVIRAHLEQVLWLDDSKMEFVFKQRWEEIIGAGPG